MTNTNIFLNGITLQELAEALAPLFQTKQVVKVETSNEKHMECGSH